MDEPEGKESYCYRVRLRCLAGIRKHKRLLAALVLGQLLSLLLCGTGVTSQLLEDRHSIAVPTSQAFINYALLAAVFGTTLATSENFIQILKHNWWKYAILGMIDVEANFIIILAYKYTNLTSIQLLDSFSLATVMFLSYIFLRTRYKVVNVMGVLLCLIGIATLVLADRKGSRLQHGSNPLLGDMLCLIGSVLYAISNVAQEYLVKNHSVTEYLGLLGVSGTIVSAVQLMLLERSKLVKIDWNTDIGLLFGSFGGSLFLFYSVMPHAMRYSSAVVVNLSLLTADIYSLLFGLFVFHYKFSLFYILALILIVAGVFIFNLKQPGPPSQMDDRHRKHRESRPHSGNRLMEEVEDRISALLESQSLDLSTRSRTSTASSYGSSDEREIPPRGRKGRADWDTLRDRRSLELSTSSKTSSASSYVSNDERDHPPRSRKVRADWATPRDRRSLDLSSSSKTSTASSYGSNDESEKPFKGMKVSADWGITRDS